ncbi:MAG: hypothetical protein ABSF69_09220 [Polyangiaceae bacterium]|jgi:hypothetical protein
MSAPPRFASLRGALYRLLNTPRGDAIAPIRIPKDVARRINVALGQPVAPKLELIRREDARRRLVALKATADSSTGARPEAPPVLVYFERDQNVRALARIEELLAARSIPWQRLDVAGDPATFDFVTRRAACDRDDLPVVFVADRPIGGYEALVRADVSGELEFVVRLGSNPADGSGGLSPATD